MESGPDDRFIGEDAPGHPLDTRRDFKQPSYLVWAQGCCVHRLEALGYPHAYRRGDLSVPLVHLLDVANTFGLTDPILFPIECGNPLNPMKLRTQALKIARRLAQLLPNSYQRPLERVHVSILAKTGELPRRF